MKKYYSAEDLCRACGIKFFAPGRIYAKDIPLKEAIYLILHMPTDSIDEWLSDLRHIVNDIKPSNVDYFRRQLTVLDALSDDQYAALVAGCSSFGLISISMELLRLRPAVQASPVYRL